MSGVQVVRESLAVCAGHGDMWVVAGWKFIRSEIYSAQLLAMHQALADRARVQVPSAKDTV